MIAAKEATLIGWSIHTTQSGQKSVTELSDEIRFPTEFNPPQIAPGWTAAATGKAKADLMNFEAVPSSFEVRNTGVMLEIDPTVLEEGKVIQVDVVPQHVSLKGFHQVTLKKPAKGIQVVLEQPQFEVAKTATSLRLHNGERVVLGVHKTSLLPNQIEIHLLKVDAVKVE